MLKEKLINHARHALLLLLLALFSSAVYSQTKISGTVIESESKPLKGATVSIIGTDQGTTTNENGEFSIAAKQGSTLSISMIGYLPSTVKVGNVNDVIKVRLTSEISGLSEVVVVGYGTQKKLLVTSAISTVNSKTLNAVPVLLVSEALQGRVAGVVVTNN